MGYRIRAILGKESVLKLIRTTHSSAKLIKLNKGIDMIPVTDALFDEINKFEDCSDVGKFTYLNENLYNYLKDVSLSGEISYIEADYFGGIGKQGSVVWKDGKQILFRDYDLFKGPINEALKMLGVTCEFGKDEFETAGLQKYRYIENFDDE